MRNFKKAVGVAIILGLFWATYELYAWIGQSGMLYCSLAGLGFVAWVRWACKNRPSFAAAYFPAIKRSMAIPDGTEVRKGIIGMWALSSTGFVALMLLGWWLILVAHVIMVWLILDDVKTAAKV